MAKHPSRPQQWVAAAEKAVEALEALRSLQEEYQAWSDGLPDNLRASVLADKLDAITLIDVASALRVAQEAAKVDLPRGFGRD